MKKHNCITNGDVVIIINKKYFVYAVIFAAIIVFAHSKMIEHVVTENERERQERYDNIVKTRSDVCRIKGIISGTNKTYVCQSSIDKSEMYLIQNGDSADVDENPYINRPVNVFKTRDGYKFD